MYGLPRALFRFKYYGKHRAVYGPHRAGYGLHRVVFRFRYQCMYYIEQYSGLDTI